MELQELKKLWEEFKEDYDEVKEREEWNKLSKEFKYFWETELSDISTPLTEARLDSIIRMLDVNATGARSSIKAVAHTGIPQKKWYKVFSEIKKKKELYNTLTLIFKDDIESDRILKIKKLYENKVYYITTTEGTFLNTIIGMWDPIKNLSIVTIKDRLTLMNYFEIKKEKSQNSIAENIVTSNYQIMEFFKKNLKIENARMISDFVYSAKFKKLWKPQKEKPLEEINALLKGRRIWRCATSGQWDVLFQSNMLSFNYLTNMKNYKEINIREEGSGHSNIENWVNKLRIDDIIFIMEKKSFYGIAIAKTQYDQNANTIILNGKERPAIEVKYINKLEIPIGHSNIILKTQPATFEKMNEEIVRKTIQFLYEKSNDSYQKLNQYLKESVIDYNIELLDTKYSGPLNQILYGPPGTGKTYNTINKAIKIINPNFNTKQDRKIVKSEFDRLIKDGQIVFTTFHQSMSYEDFVEGIKPLPPKGESNQVTYEVQDGIFKKICTNANQRTKLIQKVDEEEQDLTKDFFKDYYSSFVDRLPLHNENSSSVQLKTPTGKDFELFKNNSNSIVVKAGDKRTPMILSLNELTKVKFENKRPLYLSYENIVINEILKNLIIEEKQINNSAKNYVLIIDEINRGNVSSIFGELITLIEEDKRLGKDEELKITLPYSKDPEHPFGVPSNLYIIGTMNTADRSVEALDTALRRRFSFVEMPPKPKLIKTHGKLKDKDGILKFNGDDIDLEKLLETINSRLEVLLDRDHLIGHSYFLNVDSIEKLKDVFYRNIIPLLQEYFYGDYGKIALVLGMGFFEEPKKVDNKIFAEVKSYETDMYTDKNIFTLKNIDGNFNAALNILLKTPSTQTENS